MKKIIKATVAVTGLMILVYTVLNLVVCLSVRGRITDADEDFEEKGYDCIIVLGGGVRGDEPSPVLKERLDAAVALYGSGAAPKILVSGDHGREKYDEVNVMRSYCMDNGVPSCDIFMDHAGFSTYETMIRARDVFGVKKAVIVTQKYHLYRALYDANALGIEVSGKAADRERFASQWMWSLRETAARVKDLFWCVAKPAPTFGGEKIDITGNGEVTLG